MCGNIIMDVRDHYYDVRKGTSAARRVVLNVRGLVNDSGSVSGRGRRQAVEFMLTAHERRSGTKFVQGGKFFVDSGRVDSSPGTRNAFLPYCPGEMRTSRNGALCPQVRVSPGQYAKRSGDATDDQQAQRRPAYTLSRDSSDERGGRGG